jgi:acyl-CoA thioesterase-1
MQPFFQKGQTVLFQGDSITDCGRIREQPGDLGPGYPAKIAAIYNTLFPENEVRFVNRGVSGDRAKDMLKRYEADVRDIRPDFLSILIGINDTWRRYDSNDPTTAETYENNYRMFLEKVKADFPETKIMMIEPYLLHTMPDKICWHEDLDPKIQVARKLAKEYADYYLPLDGIFSSLCVSTYEPVDLSEDGVHPSDKGHSVIAYEYLKLLGIL